VSAEYRTRKKTINPNPDMENTDPKKVSSATQMSKVDKALHMLRECGVVAHIDDDNSIYIHNVGDCNLDVQVSTAEVPSSMT
jgi:hypothetical protein